MNQTKERPRSPACWRLRRGTWTLHRPYVMGILNVTPDSFCDGGRHATVEAAVRRALRMEVEGADIIDIGGESTRPGADPVTSEEECRRVIPVIRALRRQTAIPLSIDTCKASVADEALKAGVDVVNDVTALGDAAMAVVVRGHGAALVLMHSRGTPRTMSSETGYQDLAGEVAVVLAERAAWAESQGIERDCLCLDPGFGFAKVGFQNYVLLRELGRITTLGYPVLVGASRKSFIGQAVSLPWGQQEILPGSRVRPPDERLAGSLAFAVEALRRGAHVLRVHDVLETCDAAKVAVQCINTST